MQLPLVCYRLKLQKSSTIVVPRRFSCSGKVCERQTIGHHGNQKSATMSFRKLPNQIPLLIRNKPQSNPQPFQSNSHAKQSTNLIKAYFNNGLLNHARQLFEEMPDRDVVAWTAMISGYTACNHHNSAWMMFKDMTRESSDHPNAFTFSSVLKACKGMKSHCCGALSHGLALKHGLVGASIYVDNALLDMYATCCVSMELSHSVFQEIPVKNQVSWTTLITGFTHRDNGVAALEVFQQMFMEKAEQSPYSFSIAIRACAGITSHTYGTQIHASVVKHGFDRNIPVSNSLLDMYCKCNRFQEADNCFKEMNEKDDITWNTLISGYQNSNPIKSLHLLSQMELLGCHPNHFTFSSLITACTNLSILTCGQQIHGKIFKIGLDNNLPLANSLIDMYSKSGDIKDSKRVFSELCNRDVVSWTSMMIGFGNHGYGNEAVRLFNEMVDSGIRPDTIVFMAILTACSHSGLVNEGLSYFKLMINEYGIIPSREIYACVVDLLGRGGRVGEAYEVIKSMPFKGDESVWAAFLGACRAHGQPKMMSACAREVLDLKPRKSGIYVLLGDMYALEGKWGDRVKMRRLLNESGNKKVAGRSWVEVRDRIYSFVAGDGDRCDSYVGPIYEVLSVLGRHMVEKIEVS
ncbi:putative pentatricopeptide repeat-containing protein At1g56570 [Lactuca sativa]|uniref:Pentacotripeptide-repeat region of PRORP domain-containing protein n=1 Tax=Lactuca sativa TaxID=4236 RepID=A0A9R1UPR5_LACSA|nr:putative pentatricopeptide repeat-containing protein At1g56570 [Lactuca sativa]KAJ0191084.1 hypothetical protein LSAT_V11C800444160 [Lactuca sativa]